MGVSQTELCGEGPEEEENGEKQMTPPPNHTGILLGLLETWKKRSDPFDGQMLGGCSVHVLFLLCGQEKWWCRQTKDMTL